MSIINGETLADTLTSLNCNDDRILEGSSFDWLFENPKLKEFLESFCKAAEFKKITNVKKNEIRQGLGKSKTPAIDFCNQISETDIEKEIQKNIREIERKENVKLELKKQQSVLRREIGSIKKEKLNAETLKLKVEQDFQQEEQSCQLLQKQLSEALDSIVVNLTEFINTAECQSNETTVSYDQLNNGSRSFLNVQPYLNMEEAYLTSLRGYVNSQFKNEIWAVDNSQSFSAAKNSDSGVSLSQSNSGLSNFYKWKKELCRLKDCLLSSKEKLIRAQVLRESLKRQISLLEEKITKNIPEQSLDVWQLKLKNEQSSSKLDDLTKQLFFLSKEVLPKEILKIVNSILKDVITANYAIKIKRQQYFVNKQTQLFQLLLEQQSRLSLLHIAAQIESRQTCQLDRLVKSIVNECGKEAELSQKTLDYMKNLKICEENEAKHLPAPTDLATNMLADIIGKNKEELFVSYQSLNNSAQDFQRNSKDLKKIISKNSSEQELLTSQISSGFQSLYKMIIPMVSDCLGSVELKQQLGLLENELERLETNLASISTTFNEKVKFLENCEREKLKREELYKKFL